MCQTNPPEPKCPGAGGRINRSVLPRTGGARLPSTAAAVSKWPFRGTCMPHCVCAHAGTDTNRQGSRQKVSAAGNVVVGNRVSPMLPRRRPSLPVYTTNFNFSGAERNQWMILGGARGSWRWGAWIHWFPSKVAPTWDGRGPGLTCESSLDSSCREQRAGRKERTELRL